MFLKAQQVCRLRIHVEKDPPFREEHAELLHIATLTKSTR